MKKSNLINPEITFYVRTAKKLGFIAKSKKNILTSKQLKSIAQNKSKIPVQNQILYYNGEQVQQNKTLQIIDKSIVHVLDSRNIGKSKMKLLIKRLPQNSHTESFQIDSDMSIDSFVKNKLSQFYQEPAEKLFFVYSGRELNKQKSFTQQNIQSESQIICVHEDKDQKKATKSVVSSKKSLKTVDTVQNNENNENNQKAQNKTGLIMRPSIQIDSFKTNFLRNELIQEKKQQIKEKIQQLKHPELQTQQKEEKTGARLIKSIQQIKCLEYESDQDSDNQNDQGELCIIPKKLPQDFLLQQTRQRSGTKQSNNNNSESSSISQPNFKKKKKVSEIEVKSNASKQQKQQEIGQLKKQLKSVQTKQQEEIQQKANYFLNDSQKIVEPASKNKQNQSKNTIVTRQEIFDNNTHTYSSVIDQPEDQASQKLKENPKKDFCIENGNNNGEEVYDSQMNSYYKMDSSKMQVKCNKGFMNFSNASFLESSKIQNQKAQISIQAPLNNQQQKNRIQKSVQKYQKNKLINQASCQLLEVSVSIENERGKEQIKQKKDNKLNFQKQSDSLNFSKFPSQNNQNEQQSDNLFEEYKRGEAVESKDILIQQQQISESNLLSDIYQNQNLTEIGNSITFNLEPNPDDQVLHFKQSSIYVNVDQVEEDNQVQSDQKRQSELQTNFRDSADPSQINSNPSQIHPVHYQQFQHGQSFMQPLSLIDNLMSMIDYKINVNNVQSEDSDDEESKINRNFVNQGSDISPPQQYNQIQIQEKDKGQSNQINSQNCPSKQFLDEQSSSNFFVSYQSYKADNSLYPDQYLKQKHQENGVESDLLDKNFDQKHHSKDLESNIYKINFENQDDSYNLQNKRDSAIKIVEESQVLILNEKQSEINKSQRKQIQNSGNFLNNQSNDCSAAFHEISQANQKEENEDQPLIGNCQPYQITFRKDNKSDQSKIEQLRNSNFLTQLSNQIQSEIQEPQLLPGDYIYSTDRIQQPNQVINDIIEGFSHCF